MSYAPVTRTAGAPARGTGPGHPGLIGGIGRACYRHRWLTLLAWLAGVACLITLFISYGAPAQDNFTGSDPGQALLNQHFPRQSGDTLTLAIESAAPISSPAVRARVTGALAPFARAPHVTAVTSPMRRPARSPGTATSRSRPSSSASRPPRSATVRRSRSSMTPARPPGTA